MKVQKPVSDGAFPFLYVNKFVVYIIYVHGLEAFLILVFSSMWCKRCGSEVF